MPPTPSPADRAREWINTYTRDLSGEDLQRLFTDDTRDAFDFYSRGLDGEALAGLPWWKRAALRARQIFVAFTLKLPPARRAVYMVALVIALIGVLNLYQGFEPVPVPLGTPFFQVMLLMPTWASGTFALVLSLALVNLLMLLEVAERLSLRQLELLRDKDESHWRTVSKRPPSEMSPFTTTYLALRGLQAFGTEEQQERIATRSEQVHCWLLDAPAQDTEDRVFRLWGLKRAGAGEKELQAAAQDLLRSQRKDGGWAQTEEMESDAYATGSALAALHLAGSLAVSDPAYQRGLRFLIGGQLEDGSWLVRSRSRPFQLYFESGFPHGKDQFISAAASAWATTALAFACPPPVRDR